MEKNTFASIKLFYESRKRTPLFLVLRRFFKNKLAIVGAIVILVNAIMAIVAPLLSPYDPNEINLEDRFYPPSFKHLFGADSLGRDVLSRIIYGAREIFLVSATAVSISVVIGIFIGSFSGYFGGRIDSVLMRFTDILIALPGLLLVIVAISMFKSQSPYTVMLIMGILGWSDLARIVRSEFLTLKERAYVESAKVMGIGDLPIIFRHILPNAIAPIIVVATIKTSTYIFWESGLTFFGLGDPTVISWGSMINEGRLYLRTAWWVTVFSGLAIFLLTLAFNTVGDGLRDAFDIKQRV